MTPLLFARTFIFHKLLLLGSFEWIVPSMVPLRTKIGVGVLTHPANFPVFVCTRVVGCQSFGSRNLNAWCVDARIFEHEVIGFVKNLYQLEMLRNR